MNLSTFLHAKKQSKSLSNSKSEPNLTQIADDSSVKSNETNFTMAPSSPPKKAAVTYSQFSDGFMPFDTGADKINRVLFKHPASECISIDGPGPIKPHKSQISKEGTVWTMKGSTWQKQYAILTIDSSKLVMHLYNDEVALRPAKVLDLSHCSQVHALDSTGYKPIHEFKLLMTGYELVFGCDSVQETKGWASAINLVINRPKDQFQERKVTFEVADIKKSSSTLMNLVEDNPENESVELTVIEMLNDLTESMEMRTNKLGKMIYELIQTNQVSTEIKQALTSLQFNTSEMRDMVVSLVKKSNETSSDNLNVLCNLESKINRVLQDQSTGLFTNLLSNYEKQLVELVKLLKNSTLTNLSDEDKKIFNDNFTRMFDQLNAVAGVCTESQTDSQSLHQKIDGIGQVIEFVNISQCKIVDLLTDQLKEIPKSPTKQSAEEPKRLKAVQEQLGTLAREIEQNEDRIHDSLEHMMKGVEKLSQQLDDAIDSKDQMLQSVKHVVLDSNAQVTKNIALLDDRLDKQDESLTESMLKIQKSIQAIQNSLAVGSGDAKLIETIQDLSCHVSLMNQRQSINKNAVTSATDRTSTNSMLGLNEKVLKLSSIMENSRESTNSRLNSIEDKIRNILVQQTASIKQNEHADNTQKQMSSLLEIRAILSELDLKVTKSRIDAKSNADVINQLANKPMEAPRSPVKGEGMSITQLNRIESKLEQLASSVSQTRNARVHINEQNENTVLLATGSSEEIESKPVPASTKADCVPVTIQKLNEISESIQKLAISVDTATFENTLNGNKWSKDKIEEKIDDFLEKMANTLQYSTSQLTTHKEPTDKVVQQLICYQQDMVAREMQISQTLDSVQHTMSGLMDLVNDGHQVLLSPNSSTVSKVSNITEMDEIKQSLASIQQQLASKQHTEEEVSKIQLTNEIQDLRLKKEKLTNEIHELELRMQNLREQTTITARKPEKLEKPGKRQPNTREAVELENGSAFESISPSCSIQGLSQAASTSTTTSRRTSFNFKEKSLFNSQEKSNEASVVSSILHAFGSRK